jgi:hypothetical protein
VVRLDAGSPVGTGGEEAIGPLAPPTELGVESAGRVAPTADAGANCVCAVSSTCAAVSSPEF